MDTDVDALIVGAGHNGLVAATLLARAGWSVRVLERADRVGGAAVSELVFPGMEARLSRYAYLVSLFPSALRRELGLRFELRAREGLDRRSGELRAWQQRMGHLARAVAPTLLEPLRSREDLKALVADEGLWEDVFDLPLALALERDIPSDEERGVVLTDGLIGTFATAGDPGLRQNRCFLYHVIGDGLGRWDVPVGGMGRVTGELAAAARSAGAEILTGVAVATLDSDGRRVHVVCEDGSRHTAKHVLLNAALSLDGSTVPPGGRPEGSQLKVNMLVRRLPVPLDPAAPPERAFADTFHVNEGYDQLEQAYAEAEVGLIPTTPPCELYCHSLTDSSILGEELRASGAQTLTLFALHMPARLFAGEHDVAKHAALEATLRSLNSVLSEPIEDLLLLDGEGQPCLEALTPVELEQELGMPGGNIFHRDLHWPFAEAEEEVGQWGVETSVPNVWRCGAAARRVGGVSGIPGHNAARAVLAAG